jgi:hypothetical protein
MDLHCYFVGFGTNVRAKPNIPDLPNDDAVHDIVRDLEMP